MIGDPKEPVVKVLITTNSSHELVVTYNYKLKIVVICHFWFMAWADIDMDPITF